MNETLNESCWTVFRLSHSLFTSWILASAFFALVSHKFPFEKQNPFNWVACKTRTKQKNNKFEVNFVDEIGICGKNGKRMQNISIRNVFHGDDETNNAWIPNKIRKKKLIQFIQIFFFLQGSNASVRMVDMLLMKITENMYSHHEWNIDLVFCNLPSAVRYVTRWGGLYGE